MTRLHARAKCADRVLGLYEVLERETRAWRLWHRPPEWPASMSVKLQRAARWGHGALYACMLVSPLSGYLASNFSKHGIKFFGYKLAPWGPDLASVYGVLNALHVTTAWLLAVLIGGHALMAFKHALLDHDGVFSRMLPFRP